MQIKSDFFTYVYVNHKTRDVFVKHYAPNICLPLYGQICTVP